jgi:hypothetical protein
MTRAGAWVGRDVAAVVFLGVVADEMCLQSPSSDESSSKLLNASSAAIDNSSASSKMDPVVWVVDDSSCVCGVGIPDVSVPR